MNLGKIKNVTGNMYNMGVYCLMDGDKVIYIGSGQINDRIQYHLYQLNRNKYQNNKAPIQEAYDAGRLGISVVYTRCSNAKYNNGDVIFRSKVQADIGDVEQQYINMFEKTICNKHKKVTKSCKMYSGTNIKRHISNTGINNPACKYSLETIGNVIWMKHNGYKNTQIVDIVADNSNIHIPYAYVCKIGKIKWIDAEPIKPAYI